MRSMIFHVRLFLWNGIILLSHRRQGYRRYALRPALDLSVDESETEYVYDRHPKIVEELTTVMRDYFLNGRSTPGVP